MAFKILVVGGYGNFGSIICSRLINQKNIELIIAGRNGAKAKTLSERLQKQSPELTITANTIDIHQVDLLTQLQLISPNLLIHTSGPFQGQNYNVAIACMNLGIHYIDLADGRDFVNNIKQLNQITNEHKCSIISGASSIPGLSSAVLSHVSQLLETVENIEIAIAPGNKAPRGEATITAILSYVGKPFCRWDNNKWQNVYGWQSLHRYDFGKSLGKRWLANCDIPDLELFPNLYPNVRSVKFFAGLELSLLHVGLWILSWFTRGKIIKNWSKYSALLIKISRWFESYGTNTGGMYVKVKGQDASNKTKTLTWILVAKQGHGPYIPAIPAVILAKKLARGETLPTGAQACLNLFTLEEFLSEVEDLDIHTQIQKSLWQD